MKIANYLTKSKVRFPYMKFPKYLLTSDLNETSRELYMILLDRAMLSQKNNWVDENGHVYVIYPIKDLAAVMKKSQTAIKDALKKLEDGGYIQRVQQGFQKPSRIYVMIPEGVLPAGKPFTGRPENRPSRSRYSDYPGDGKPAASNNKRIRINKENNINYNCEGDSL